MTDATEATEAKKSPVTLMDALNGDTLHKTINWTTLVGIITTIAVSYFANVEAKTTDETIKSGVAREVIMLREWSAGAAADMVQQAAEIVKLRETVAGLKLAVDILGIGRRPLAVVGTPVAADVDQMPKPVAADVDQMPKPVASQPDVKASDEEAVAAPSAEAIQKVRAEIFPE